LISYYFNKCHCKGSSSHYIWTLGTSAGFFEITCVSTKLQHRGGSCRRRYAAKRYHEIDPPYGSVRSEPSEPYPSACPPQPSSDGMAGYTPIARTAGLTAHARQGPPQIYLRPAFATLRHGDTEAERLVTNLQPRQRTGQMHRWRMISRFARAVPSGASSWLTSG